MKKTATAAPQTELVIITGLSGSGKGTVLKALEDLGYYSVDNLPIELIPKFAQLTKDAPTIRRAALVVDIREGAALERFPALFKRMRKMVPTRLMFLEADESSLIRRFSETRRPHPLGIAQSVSASIRHEREQLERSASWRIRSSTPPSSTCMSCGKRFTGLSESKKGPRKSWCR